MNKIKVNPRSYYLSLILMIVGMMVGFSQEKTINGDNVKTANGGNDKQQTAIFWDKN